MLGEEEAEAETGRWALFRNNLKGTERAGALVDFEVDFEVVVVVVVVFLLEAH